MNKLSQLIKHAETFEGRWKLTPDHKLVYRKRGKAEQAALTGTLVAGEAGALVIAVTARGGVGKTVAGTARLSGRWELDKKNRITFYVERGSQRYDRLTFQGAWELNDHHEVVYAYKTRETLKGGRNNKRRARQTTQKLTFKGFWDIAEDNRLTYLVEGDTESAFRVRGTFETKSLRAKTGALRYQAGIEYRTARGARKRVKRTLTLFGKWKLSRDLALSFEVEYSGGRKAPITLGADFKLPWREGPAAAALPDKISIDLKNRSGRPLGIELVLTKDFLKGKVKTFLRLARSTRESAVEVGVSGEW